ncbi:2,3-epoxybenzoyl-CoA dihydrolase [Alphaproteobacteria bacterium]|nr:2,3-epoxybenzoyl-CoA dihydrolase [Alphaproteobacteria bacterium]
MTVDRDIITYDRHPDSYRHWALQVDGATATLTLSVDEDAGLVPGYKLKLNSYDLGVDMELYDAVQRLRFEHPCVKSVIITSGVERMFCAGANIYMLSGSSHEWKVNFCKFTNETRNGLEDSSRDNGLKFLAACNGTTAGGGYELALACDEILLVDDRSSAVSLPEVALLGVLPGTGGLTRVVDKRKVRRDLADVFCTSEDGVRGRRAVEWKLVDDIAQPAAFWERAKAHASRLAALSQRPEQAVGVPMTPLNRRIDAAGYHYDTVDAQVDRDNRTVTITLRAPVQPPATDVTGIVAAGMTWWPLKMARELDDAILLLRTNELDCGVWLLRSEGDGDLVLAADAALVEHQDHWFVREVTGMLRRTLARLDVTSRSLIALIDENSCFVGSLFEVALAADRSYMLDLPAEEGEPPVIALSQMNFGSYAMVNDAGRLAARFANDAEVMSALQQKLGQKIDPAGADALGLVTFIPDDIDWEDEVRLAIEERVSLSPDALTGMEANLRFAGQENVVTKVFGRLSAWQNWIFNRPNAVGDDGALKLFGTGSRAKFNWKRV